MSEKVTQVLMAISAMSPDESLFRLEIMTRRLQSIAADAKVDYYEAKNGADVTVTISSSVFLVDIDISSSGEIIKVKLTYAVENADVDTRVEEVLAQLLGQKEFDTFARCVRELAFREQFVKDINHVLRFVERDLRAIHSVEIERARSRNAATGGGDPLLSVLNLGHGVVQVNTTHLGPSVIYWADPTIALDGDLTVDVLKKSPARMWRADIILDECSTQQLFPLPAPDGQYLLQSENIIPFQDGTGIFSEPLKFFKPAAGNCVAVNACFALDLLPGVPCVIPYAEQIFASSGIVPQQSMKEGQGSLATMLQYFSATTSVSAIKTTADRLCSNDAFFVKCVFTCPPVQAFAVTRVKFINPASMFPILQLLRRALVFNTILQSVLIGDEIPTVTPQPSLGAFVEVSAWDPPNSVSIKVDTLFPHHCVKLSVELDQAHVPVVKSSTSFVLDDARLSRLLSLTLDLSVVVRAVIEQL